MALKVNPITGQLEEDGLPEDPNALPAGPMGGIAPPVAATGAGGAVPAAPPAAPVAVSLFPPKPERETTRGHQQLIKGVGSQAADVAAASAGQQVLAASAAQEGVDQQEGELKGQQFAEEERQRENAGLDMAALAEQRKRAIQEALAEDDDQIRQVNKAYREKNDAEIDYFKGRPAAEIFTALLRGLDRAASSFRGESGPTGVDRVIGEKIAAYKAQKIGEWERAKENRAIKKQNAAAYQEELTRQEIAVNNKLLAGLDVLKARTEKMAAGLTPERAAALRQQRDATFLSNEARLKQEREQAYDRLSRFSETTRSGGAADGAKPPPLASVDDTEKVTKLEQIANERRELAAQIEGADEGAWKALQEADKLQQKEEGFKQVPLLGSAFMGAVRGVASTDAVGAIDRALGKTPGGLNVEDKLRYNPKSQGLWRGISKVVTQEAKDLGGAVTESDLGAKRAELGVQGQSAKEMAATLRRQAEDFERRAAQMRGQRTFIGPTGAAVRERLGVR
jgi:hypothetical protein